MKTWVPSIKLTANKAEAAWFFHNLTQNSQYLFHCIVLVTSESQAPHRQVQGEGNSTSLFFFFLILLLFNPFNEF